MSTSHQLRTESRREIKTDTFKIKPDSIYIPELFVPEVSGQVKREVDDQQKFTSLIRRARYIANPLCRALVDIDVPLKTPLPFTIVKGSEFKFLTKKYGWNESELLLEKYAYGHRNLIDISVSEILADTDKHGQPKLVAHLDDGSIEKLSDEFAASEEFLLSHGAKPFPREKNFRALTIARFDTWSDCSRAQLSVMSFLEDDVDRTLLQVAPAETVSPYKS